MEEKIITNYLPNFCFKDTAHKQQQQQNFEKLEGEIIQEEHRSIEGGENNMLSNGVANGGNNVSNVGSSANNLSSSANNITNHSIEKNDFLQKKKSRNANNANYSSSSRNGRKGRFYHDQSSNLKEEQEYDNLSPGHQESTTIGHNNQIGGGSNNSQVSNNGQTVGVKLICDSPNEEVKKYFSKTVSIFLYIPAKFI